MRVQKYKLSCIKEKSFNYNTNKKILQASHAAEILRSLYEQGQIEHKEKMWVIALNTSNQFIGTMLLSEGGLNATVVDPKIVFQFALLANANSIIIGHNHPSGNLLPSDSDIKISKQLEKAAEVFDMKMLDSIIVTEEGFASLK